MSIGRLAIVAALLLAAGCSGGAPDTGPVAWAALIPPSSDTLDEAEGMVGFRLVLPSYLPQQMGIYSFQRFDRPTTSLGQSGESVTEAWVSIDPLPQHMDQRSIEINSISITEWQRRTGEPEVGSAPVDELTKIGQITVGCYGTNDWATSPPGATPSPGVVDIPGLTITPGPTINPQYDCLWDTGELRVEVLFRWWLPLPGPLTPEMREEAMKVVRSMIEDPYRP